MWIYNIITYIYIFCRYNSAFRNTNRWTHNNWWDFKLFGQPFDNHDCLRSFAVTDTGSGISDCVSIWDVDVENDWKYKLVKNYNLLCQQQIVCKYCYHILYYSLI